MFEQALVEDGNGDGAADGGEKLDFAFGEGGGVFGVCDGQDANEFVGDDEGNAEPGLGSRADGDGL